MLQTLEIINSQLRAPLSYSTQASYFVLPFPVSLQNSRSVLEGICYLVLHATSQASEVRLSSSLLYPGLRKSTGALNNLFIFKPN